MSLGLAACESNPASVEDVATRTLAVDVLGGTRSAGLYVPESAGGSAASPLLLLFHGATQGARGIELMSWLYPIAEEHGIVVAFPQASGDYWNTPNSPPGYWDVPDIQFVDALIARIDADVGVDLARVYAAGFSNGAIFAEILACLRGTRIAGLAIVGAAMSADISISCPWERPVPTVVLFGDTDPQFYWDEGIAAGTGMLGGARTAEWLAESNGCDVDPEIIPVAPVGDDGTGVQLWRYGNCAERSAVDFYRILGGGHTWPGSPINLGAGFGRKTRLVSASETIVDFFLQFALPEDLR